MPNCERCGKAGLATIMSTFNTDLICLGCKEQEKRHPKYQAAYDAEQAAVASGNYNFPGIGKPDDL